MLPSASCNILAMAKRRDENGTFSVRRRHIFVRVVARFFSEFPEVRLPGLLVEAGPGGVVFGQPRLGF
jgi:hypothetical protein